MFNSVRSRLIISHFLIVVASIIILSFSLFIFLRSNGVADRLDFNRLNDVLRTTTRTNPPPPTGNLDSLQAYAVDVAELIDARVLFVNDRGQVMIDSRTGLNNPPATPIVIQPVNPPVAGRGQFRDNDREVWLFVSAAAGPTGWRLLIAMPRSRPLIFFLENFSLPLLQSAAAGILISVVLALFIARSVSRPMQNLAQAVDQVAGDNFDHAVPVAGPGELRLLARAFNDMIARVKSSQQSRRDFVANVSHELKTPLTSIHGFSQAIIDGTAGDPDSVRRSAAIINEEAERMRRLVDGLLDLARLDAGQSALHRTPTDLSAILLALAERLAPRAAKSNIALHTDLEALASMHADSDRLAQVFTNLLDNALKHTPAGGAITLGARMHGGWAEITVTDNGQGIPAEDLPRIFERFYRVDKSRVAGKGYGLGLAITKEIVQAHGGSITAESVHGLGTKFTVRLPVAASDDPTIARRRM